MSSSIECISRVMFGGQVIRAVLMDGQYWFVAKDVAQALHVVWRSNTMQAVHESQKKKLYHSLFCEEKKILWLIKYNALHWLFVQAKPSTACALMDALTLEHFPAYFDGKVRNDKCFVSNIWETLYQVYVVASMLQSLQQFSYSSIEAAKAKGKKLQELSRRALLGTAFHMRERVVMDQEQQEVAMQFNKEPL